MRLEVQVITEKLYVMDDPVAEAESFLGVKTRV